MGRGGDLTIQPPEPPPKYNHEKPEPGIKPRVRPSFFREAWGMEIVLGICITIVGIVFVVLTPTVIYQTQTAVLGGGLMVFGVLVFGLGLHKYRQPKERKEYEEPSESDPLSSVISSSDSRQSSRRQRHTSDSSSGSVMPERRLSMGPGPSGSEGRSVLTERNNLQAALLTHHRAFIPQRAEKNNLSKNLQSTSQGGPPQKNSAANIVTATIEHHASLTSLDEKNNIVKAMNDGRRRSSKRHSKRCRQNESPAHEGSVSTKAPQESADSRGDELSSQEKRHITNAMVEYYHNLLSSPDVEPVGNPAPPSACSVATTVAEVTVGVEDKDVSVNDTRTSGQQSDYVATEEQTNDLSK